MYASTPPVITIIPTPKTEKVAIASGVLYQRLLFSVVVTSNLAVVLTVVVVGWVMDGLVVDGTVLRVVVVVWVVDAETENKLLFNELLNDDLHRPFKRNGVNYI